MPPPLELPTIQNWSCHNCGGCCRQHLIEISPEEQARITAQNWTAADGIPAGSSIFVRLGLFPWSRRYRLGHQPDGGCIFLDERGLCRIHAKFGEAAKPLACRIYPFAFHPAGKKVVVSLRYSCPSVVGNRGRPVDEQKSDLKTLERLVVPEGAERVPPPEISPGERLEWNDTLRFIDKLDGIFAGSGPVLVDLIRALRLIELTGQARFSKVRGERLDEFLDLVAQAAAQETPEQLTEFAEPSATGKMQFRLLTAQYARKDTFAEQQLGWRNRWKLFRAAIRFAKGTGTVPALQPLFFEVPFTEIERSFGPLPAEANEILRRYLRVKTQGLHFCGAAYYNVPLVEGFQSLALIVPATLWIARWLAASARRKTLQTDDVARALAIADHHHGYSPAFGTPTFRGRVRLLARLGDISKLIAWYGR